MDTIRAWMAPTPGAAKALGPGFVTRLFQQLLDALTHPIKDGHLNTQGVVDALEAMRNALTTIFPELAEFDVQSSINEMTTSLTLLINAMRSNSLQVSALPYLCDFLF